MSAAEAQPKAKVIEHPQLDESTGFDYRTHIRDSKTGRLHRVQNYARHSRGTDVLLERPVGSGNCFHENGTSAGNWDTTGWKKLSDTHKAAAPQALNREDELMQRNDALEKELAALRAEAEKQQSDKKQVQKA